MSPRKDVEPTLLGNYIIRRRKAHVPAWNTAELARAAELPYGTVRNVEQGMSRKPSEKVLRALVRALACDESIVFALAGYGEAPPPRADDFDALIDELGDEAPLWREALDFVRHKMTPDQQRQALAGLRAQISAASRHW